MNVDIERAIAGHAMRMICRTNGVKRRYWHDVYVKAYKRMGMVL